MYRLHLQTDHQLRSGCRQDVRLVLDANVLLDKYLCDGPGCLDSFRGGTS